SVTPLSGSTATTTAWVPYAKTPPESVGSYVATVSSSGSMPDGRWSGRAFAANAISATLILADGPYTAPASMRTSPTSACNRCAPMGRIFSGRAGEALPTAPPANTIDREANVPNPYGPTAVSP